jgi:hypothetical protein
MATDPSHVPESISIAKPLGPFPTEVSEKDVQMIATAIGSFAQPLAESQKVVATEATKQAQIRADLTRSVYRGFFYIAVLVIILAGAAMFTGKDQLAEKIVFALLGFLGGMGFSRWTK